MRPPRLVGSAEGRIARMALKWPAPFVLDRPGLVGDVLRACDQATAVVVVTETAAVAALQALVAAVGHPRTEILSVADGTLRTPWIQDDILALDGAGTVGLLAGASTGPERGTRLVHDRLVEAGIGVNPSGAGVALRGGNLLVGDDFILIGADEWRRWSEAAAADGVDPARRFAETVDGTRRLVVVAGGGPHQPGPSRLVPGPDGRMWREPALPGVVETASRQPLFHIDMMIALAGRAQPGAPYRLVVGDPADAADRFGTERPPDELVASFDTTAALLIDAGFAVLRCPLPLLREPAGGGARRFDLFYATVLNLWCEIAPDLRRVTLPHFATPEHPELGPADEAIRALWQDLGFAVVDAGDGWPLARRGGGLNCASRVLARDDGGG